MIKKHEAHYKGMSKDIASDLQTEKYFDAANIRILATDQKSSFAITNESGNELVFVIPTPVFDTSNTRIKYTVGLSLKYLTYSTVTSVIPRCELEESYSGLTSGVQQIIGTKELRDSALIVTTDSNGWDCFWELKNLNNGDFDLDLLYMGDLSLSKDYLIQILYNYENSIIQKVYFVDGIHQLRFFNIRQSTLNGDRDNLIDVSSSSIDVVSTYKFSQPEITGVISGGSHLSGMIQYAYGLYILNGAQTTVSPPSILTPIDKGAGLGGGEVNENLGRSVNLKITNIDTKFTHIIVYSIKYTSYNENPQISIVTDQEVGSFDEFLFTDDGNNDRSISLEAFVFLGSSPLIPMHIATKDNRLFPINIKEKIFDVDLDMRSYSFNNAGVSMVLDRAYLLGTSVEGTLINASNYVVPPKNDSINADYDVYKYQSDGVTKGSEGKYVKIESIQTPMSNSNSKKLQFLKDRELYRFGIKFYNRRGQTSDPIWMSDLKTPQGNLEGNFNQLKVTLKPDFYTWLATSSNFSDEDDKPVGYKIIRADRQLTDQTIYSQGMINPMVANYLNDKKDTSLFERKRNVNGGDSDIIPSMTRMFETSVPFVACKDYHLLAWTNVNDYTGSQMSRSRSSEGFKAAAGSDHRAQNMQHNRLMQFFSPEVLFRNNEIDASYKLRIVGLMKQDYIANWSTETNPITATSDQEAKFFGGTTNDTPGVTDQTFDGNANNLSDNGFFGPTNGPNTIATHQSYRRFTGGFYAPTTTNTEWEIYGAPELTQVGADFRAYNNDSSLRYSNNLKTMRMDNWVDSRAVRSSSKIRGCNTNGAKCITFAEGSSDPLFSVEARKSIEQLYNSAGILETKGVMLAEFVKESTAFYVGGIYGGFSYEAKSNASYIDIGVFTEIDENNVTIESPGDTFVEVFTFSKMAKDDLEITSTDFNRVCEIVSIRLETTVDLKNRHDLSLDNWDNRWQPRYEEYQKYNNVYSQQPTLVKSTDTGSKIKKIQEFDGRIMASKEKIPGEFIDSWTDFLSNEGLDLDGKYGPINSVVNLRDEIFCLQDTGVAKININPRAQTVSDDGVTIQLGSGGIIHDYTYVSTTTGCINRFGSVTSENAFYFVDLINKGIMVFDGSRIGRLSDSQGFHHELLNRMNYESLSLDNAVLGTGVSLGYNPVNSDVYFSFLQPRDNFTLGFNEKISSFVSYYSYVPAWYINKGSILISSDVTNTSLWEHFKGSPNSFYGKNFRSSITLHVAPAGNEIILNGASYKMELEDSNGLEVYNKGLTRVRLYNDYQDSGYVSLEMRKNVFKKFRNWKINFPRDKNSRDRIRSAWGFVELVFDNPDGNKLILHDISIFYTQH
jgi:hypothetical protein